MRTLCTGWALGAATAGSLFLIISESSILSRVSCKDFLSAGGKEIDDEPSAAKLDRPPIVEELPPSARSALGGSRTGSDGSPGQQLRRPGSEARATASEGGDARSGSQAARFPEEGLIDELFERYDCHQVFFDVGANIGVQTRKVFQPEQFKGALDLKPFDDFLGPPPRCSVCAIGIEPNPRQQQSLDAVTEHLTRAGAGVLFLRMAAAVMDAPVTFDALPDKKHHDWGAKVGFASDLHQLRNETHELVTVPGVDVSRLIHYIDGKLREQAAKKRLPARGSILMKLDVEFSELVLVPLMFMTGAICKVTAIQFEDHSKLLTMDRDWRRNYVKKEMDNFRKSVEDCPQTRKPVIIEQDDEASGRGGQPWPKGPICHGPAG